MIQHNTIWAAPAPLWAEATRTTTVIERAAAFARPAILRFAGDQFMDELAAILERDPSQLPRLRVVEESWRRPAPAVPPPPPLDGLTRRLRTERRALPAPAKSLPANAQEQASLAASTLTRPPRLYHPAAGRFYLVSACLVCEQPGMPDHVLESGRNERASFVVRRLLPRADLAARPPAPAPLGWEAAKLWEEHAFVTRDGEQLWVKAEATRRADGEEQLPLFPMNYIAEDGRRRRLLAGLVPVARRDAYVSTRRGPLAPVEPGKAPPADAARDPRLTLLRNDFVQPYWSAVDVRTRGEELAKTVNKADDLSAKEKAEAAQKARDDAEDQVRVISWYALLDLSALLADYAPYVRRELGGAVEGRDLSMLPAHTLTSGESLLLADLRNARDGALSLGDALRDIETFRRKLEDVTQTYTRTDPANPPNAGWWPTFVFRLDATGLASLFSDLGNGLTPLENRLAGAMPTATPSRTPPPLLAGTPAPDAGAPGYFIIRCLYECPACGSLRPPVLSAATPAVEFASFFEPDAPARPIRIILPIDSTPGGLRKFARNTALMLSDQLACQVKRLGKLSFGDLVLSVLPWPFHKDLPADKTDCGKGASSGIGMICTLSIPIITICALILLMIIVALFDLVFRWIPYFILCFPLPNFKGKK